MSLRAWLEERTGLPSALERAQADHVPGGARWARTFGAALLGLLLVQAASGLGLALSYAPSAVTAWESVAALQRSALGALLRGLHAHGASLVVLVALAHLLQTALYGAYRRPREASWWLGLLLLGLLLAFVFTGTLLPWDERGFMATQVALSLAGEVPLLGGALRRLVAGGPRLGNLSLTRFAAAHLALLPLALLALCAAHLAVARRHGRAPPPGLGAAARSTRSPWWPGQAARDAGGALLLGLLLLALALAWPAPLGAPADPGRSASARPEWVFLPLYGLLRALPGPLAGAAALLAPLALLGLLAALPWLDRQKQAHESWRDRRALALALGGALLAAVALGVLPVWEDARDPEGRAARAAALARARTAQELAAGGVPPQGALFLVRDQPHLRGQRLFQRKCLACHRVGEAGTRFGPDLGGYLSRDWIRGALVEPRAPHYWGTSGLKGMESFARLSPPDLAALVELLHALRGLEGGPQALPPAHATGLRLFQRECAGCHTLDPAQAPDGGPSLAAFGSDAWLRALLLDPGTQHFFGRQNQMPAFGPELSRRDVDDLIAFLRTLESPGAAAAPKALE